MKKEGLLKQKLHDPQNKEKNQINYENEKKPPRLYDIKKGITNGAKFEFSSRPG